MAEKKNTTKCFMCEREVSPEDCPERKDGLTICTTCQKKMEKAGKSVISVADAGKRGGTTTKERYGDDHYRRIGKMGGKRCRELIEAGKQAEKKAE